MRPFLPFNFGAVLLGFGLLAFSSLLPAHAAGNSFQSYNDEVWGALGASFFNYKEPSQAPDLPDSEHGALPSLAAGVSYMTSGNLYLSLDGNVNFGDANYNGTYYYFPTVPLKGTTHETIANIDGKAGFGVPLGGRVMFIPYLDLGYRYWDRDLGADQTEDYGNFDALGGLMLQVMPVNRLFLTGYAAGGTTFDAKMQTDGDNYDLGSSGIYKIGGKIGFNVLPQMELFTTLDYDYFRYGQSGVVDGSYEPNSHTSDTTWRVGLGYHFQ